MTISNVHAVRSMTSADNNCCQDLNVPINPREHGNEGCFENEGETSVTFFLICFSIANPSPHHDCGGPISVDLGNVY